MNDRYPSFLSLLSNANKCIDLFFTRRLSIFLGGVTLSLSLTRRYFTSQVSEALRINGSLMKLSLQFHMKRRFFELLSLPGS
jgi:hypothetical protein